MSTTVTTIATPIATVTNDAVNASTGLITLATAAEQNPVVKADLQAQFDSYSHSPVIVALASVAGMLLTQRNITVDNTLLTVVVGLVVTGMGYGWQWISMKLNKPVKVVA